jgi:hypothetical protein
MFFNFILAYDYVTNTFVSVNTLQPFRLGTDKLKSIYNYTINFFVENNYFLIFVKMTFMNKIVLLIIMILSISSCTVQKFYSENGRQISRKTYNKHIDRKFNYIMNHMNEQDKNVLKYMKIDKRVKDSLIYIYDNH